MGKINRGFGLDKSKKRIKIKAKKVNIKINTADGKKTIPALSFGKFAYHKMLDYDGYVVTHVNSGMAVKQGIFTQSDARKLAINCTSLGAKWDGQGNMPDSFGDSIKSLLGI